MVNEFRRSSSTKPGMVTRAFSESAWPEVELKPASPGRWRKCGVAMALGLAAGLGTAVFLPPSMFHARAVVGTSGVPSPLIGAWFEGLSDSSVPEPVIQRAAESLIGTGFPVRAPDLVERIGLAVGLDGARPTGKVSRLATDLAAVVTTRLGQVPGSLDILALNPDADRAAKTATAVAEALVAYQDDLTAQARRKRDVDALARLQRLKSEAVLARGRLAALGGVEADPAQLRAAAAAQTANAQARAEAIRAILASGAPPLSDRRDVPSGIEALQTSYLDLTRQLAKARETLGDRHTTIISLQAEVRHAAASLTAEWRRLGRLAEAELSTARQREMAQRKADTSADSARRASIDEARRNVQIADDNVARAQSAQRDPTIEDSSLRILVRAPIPTFASGFSSTLRILMAALTGLAVFAVSMWLGLRQADRFIPLETDAEQQVPERSTQRHERTSLQADRSWRVEKGLGRKMRQVRHGKSDKEPDFDFAHLMSNLVPDLESIECDSGEVPTILVGTGEADVRTTPAALSLARAAAQAGHRVLLVEVERERSDLAGAVDADADPVLVDFFGTLRVMIPAEGSEDHLYLAPDFAQGPRIASALARQSDTPLVDDMAAEFDFIVIDGGLAFDCATAGWTADALVRVGKVASRRDDQQFAAAFGLPESTLLRAVVASAAAPLARREPIVMPVTTTTRPEQKSPNIRSKVRPFSSLDDRTVVPLRRKVGSR